VERSKKAAPVRISLPFQTIETVNERAADRSRNLDSIVIKVTDILGNDTVKMVQVEV
jgi:hypothetical protein